MLGQRAYRSFSKNAVAVSSSLRSRTMVQLVFYIHRSRGIGMIRPCLISLLSIPSVVIIVALECLNGFQC